MTQRNYRIGVDTGGTFTDSVLLDDTGALKVFKTPSTPHDPAISLMDSLIIMAESEHMGLEDFSRSVEIIIYGTTVATNAVLTRNGAKTGLLTTEGHRDVLAIRTGEHGPLFHTLFRPPEPLVERRLRLPVKERVNVLGEVLLPLDLKSVEEQIEKLIKEDIKALTICFLHSYMNDSHEKIVKEIVQKRMPGIFLTVSSELLPQMREYNRCSTCVMNSYVGPIMSSYIQSLKRRLAEVKYQGTFLLMQANAGVITPDAAQREPVRTTLSGPAAGPLAGRVYTTPNGWNDYITVDMGGTSFDVSIIQQNEPTTVSEANFGGYRIAIPMVDVGGIGAGGGSIAWIDAAGMLQVGPQSAGADPGPACYGRGGEKPTVTDADLILGYLNKDYFLGGRLPLSYDKAAEALERHIGKPLGMSIEEAAYGVFRVVNTSMSLAMREVSIERGLDPRNFVLIAAGGAGPVHAAAIAGELEMPVILIPKYSSIFCASGMLFTDLKYDFVRGYVEFFSALNEKKFKALFDEMEAEGRDRLRRAGVPKERIEFIRSCDMRYFGQITEVEVTMTRGEIDSFDLSPMISRFHEKHNKLYGYDLRDMRFDNELVACRVTAIGKTEKPVLKEQPLQSADCSECCKGARNVYLPSEKRFKEIKVYNGDMMGFGNKIIGPAVIEQNNTSILVLPEYNLVCDRLGSFVMYLKSVEDKLRQEKKGILPI